MATQPPPGQPEYPPPMPGGYYPPPGAPAGWAPGGQFMPAQAYTSWIQRVGAYVVDSIPVMVLYAVAYGVLLGTGTEDCREFGSATYTCSNLSGTGVAVFLLAWVASLAYGIWNWGYRQGTTGSSIGKSALHFKVVSEATGQPIGFGSSFLRQIVHIVDGLVCYLGYLWPLWDAKRQTFADKIMSTVCVPTQ